MNKSPLHRVAGSLFIKEFPMTELNLWLDSYDDIYSDFDSRHYHKRRISEDFLYELEREMKYKEGKANCLMLLLPNQRWDEAVENSICASLSGFFQKQFLLQEEKYRRHLKKDLLFLLGVILVML